LFLHKGIEKNGGRNVLEGNLSELHYSAICRKFFDAISYVQLLGAKARN